MKAEILDYMGSDKMVANVARVSYDKEIVGEFGNKDVKLLKYLATHNHISPFFHPKIQFRIECPIFVERQIFKTAVGVDVNSISGRYVDFSDSYWEPEVLRLQSKDSKQGSEGTLDDDENHFMNLKIKDHIEASKELYAELCEKGVAKEMSRIILPLCLNTKFIWTGSLFAFVRLCKLRLKPDAQQETRDLVQIMLDQVKGLDDNPFRNSLEVFGF